MFHNFRSNSVCMHSPMCACRAISPLVASNPLHGLRRYESTSSLPEAEKSDKPKDARENVTLLMQFDSIGSIT